MSTSTYTEAFDGTRRALERRARNFRNLVVAVVSVGAGALCVAAMTGRLAALSGLLLVMPVCGAYVYRDLRVLNDWQRTILTVWKRGGLELYALRHALLSDPSLPGETLAAMLSALPADGEAARGQALPESTREAISALACALERCRADTVALRCSALAIVALVLPLAAHAHSARGVWAVTAACVPLLLRRALVSYRFRELSRQLREAENPQAFDPQCAEIAGRLDWSPVSRARREVLMRTLGGAPRAN